MFQSIHENDPDPKLLAYQYLQTLPQIAQGAGNTMWMIPSELTSALKALGTAFEGRGQAADAPAGAPAAGPPRTASRQDGQVPAVTAAEESSADAALAEIVHNEAELTGPSDAVREAELAAAAAAIATAGAELPDVPLPEVRLPEPEAPPRAVTSAEAPEGSAAANGAGAT